MSAEAASLQLLCVGTKMPASSFIFSSSSSSTSSSSTSSSSSSLLLLVVVLMTMTLMTPFVAECQARDERTHTDLECEIPAEWRGRYFQSGLGLLVVSKRGITTKGLCIQRSRDYFLFHNRDKNCFQCLLLLRQHRNIIQYKESYCSPSSSALKLVCTEIRVETPLYTLVREPAVPVPCPFRETSYRFDFNDLQHGFCGRPSSSARPCSLPSRLRMHFSDCIKGPRFENKDVELECLATWKDGSETYLYGRLTGSGLLTKDDRYRCFKYQTYGSDVFMAMTADATCRGLRSSTDGPFLLEFFKDESVISQPNCRYPDWLKDVTWRTLSGQYRYRWEDDGAAIYRMEEHGPRDRSFNVYRCHQIHELSNDRIVLITQSVRNCSFFFQCLVLERISPTGVKFYEGVERDYFTECRSDEFDHNELLIPADDHLASCPNPGVHHTTPSGGCIHRLNIGCQDETKILIDHSCSPGQPGLVFDCLAFWTESPKTFVVLKKPNSTELLCFIFTRNEEMGVPMVFGSDALSECHRNWSLPFNPPALSYSILRRENCRRTIRTTDGPEVLTSTARTTTSATTTFISYHLNELHDYDYDEVKVESIDEPAGRRPEVGFTENIDGHDYDDDDDDDEEDTRLEEISMDLSGDGLDGTVPDSRRNPSKWTGDPRGNTTAVQGDPSDKSRTAFVSIDVQVTGNSFRRDTDPSSSFDSPVVAVSGDETNLNLRRRTKAPERISKTDDSVKNSPSHSAASANLRHRHRHHAWLLTSVIVAVVSWVQCSSRWYFFLH